MNLKSTIPEYLEKNNMENKQQKHTDKKQEQLILKKDQ